jgi:predicted dienelactone hydrolase
MRAPLVIVSASVLFVAACSSDAASPATTAVVTTPAEETVVSSTPVETTAAPTTVAETTTTVAVGPADFTEAGAFAAGVRTISLGDRNMEVWYPVDPASVAGTDTEIFDQLSVFPESLKPLIPAELQGEIDTGTYRDAAPFEGEELFPVVVYSHGFGGYRQVATNFTSHLAQWGYVVISIDHLERGIAAQASGTLGGGAPDQDVLDVSAGIDALRADAMLGALVDADQVIITGHSAGAGTAARAANTLDDISAFVSLSGGAPGTTEAGETGIRGVSSTLPNGTYEFTIDAVSDTALTITADGTSTEVPLDDLTFDAFGSTLTLFAVTPAAGGSPEFKTGTVSFTIAAPTKPGLVIASELDEVIPPSRSFALYEAMSGPRWYVEIAKAGHNSFTDSCVGIRELGGLDALIPLIGEAQVKRANDGCTDAYADPLEVRDVTNQYVVAFLRTEFGQPVDPAALTEAAIDGVGDVTLVQFASN